MFATVKVSLESTPTFDSGFLAQHHGLFISCFKSLHRSVLNESILLWNHTVGTADSLDYPQDMQKVLMKLKGATNIQLPGFPDVEDTEVSFTCQHLALSFN